MRLLQRLAWTVWIAAGLAGIVALGAAGWLWTQGIGTRTPPGAVETSLSRAARNAMIPSGARARQNPEPATEASLRSGLEHWADHCATCHANDGSGAVPIGRALYPPVPDMRLPATQGMTDGELFYIIEHGVKLTGMPAWGDGTPESETSSWHLVQFIRRLPALSDEEIAEMDALNPRGPDAWRAFGEERRFLAGDGPGVSPAPSHKH
jgi:mono/diheme cytochrome c family protein